MVAGSYEAQASRHARWSDAVETADAGFEQLKEAQRIMKEINGRFTAVEDSLKKDMKALADSLGTAISDLQERYMLPQGTSGYHDESELLSTYLWRARSGISNGAQMPSQNGLYAIEQFEAKVEEIKTDINSLFEGLWMEWRASVEALEQPALFEEIEKLD